MPAVARWRRGCRRAPSRVSGTATGSCPHRFTNQHGTMPQVDSRRIPLAPAGGPAPAGGVNLFLTISWRAAPAWAKDGLSPPVRGVMSPEQLHSLLALALGF